MMRAALALLLAAGANGAPTAVSHMFISQLIFSFHCLSSLVVVSLPTAQDCTVPGLAAPADGALDAACVDGTTLADAAGCALTCNTGFALSGTQPSCAAGVFDVGSVACAACASQTGCATDAASGACTGAVLDCGAAAAGYNLVGVTATANVCVAPTTAVVGVLTMPTCTGFTTGAIACSVEHVCDAGYADVDDTDDDYPCAADGAELTVSGCDACTGQAGCTTSGAACFAGTSKLECTVMAAGYTTDATSGFVREMQCTVPTSAQGYDVTTLACSATGGVTTTCETAATCGPGSTGTVAATCDVDSTDLTLAGCVLDLVCVLPIVSPTGTDVSAMACSTMTSAGVTCETPATCTAGYSGNLAYSCAVSGDPLIVTGCGDTDECDGTDCGTAATCVGSAAPSTDYTCSCGPGLTGASQANAPATCSDTDGCDDNGSNRACGTNAICQDQPAPLDGYTCQCVTGFSGATNIGSATTCTANPTCDAHASLCSCTRDTSDPDKPADSTCSGATVDVFDTTAGCVGAACTVADCCVTFMLCPSDSRVIGAATGAGHGQTCTCDDGYSGSPTWDPATEAYVGTCEPIACPDHPLYPAATGGKTTGGGGSTTCSCPAGYDVKPHCQDTTQDTCTVAMDGAATDDDGCGAASLAPVDCAHIAPVAQGSSTCSIVASCSGAAPGQSSCEAVVNGNAQPGDCEYTAGSMSVCSITATCPATTVEADCIVANAVCDDTSVVTKTACEGAGSTWAAPCAFTAPACSVSTPSCTGTATTIPATCGTGDDAAGLPCAVDAAGSSCDALDGTCAFVAASTPTCDLTNGSCPDGCDGTPAPITVDADCTTAGGTWTAGSCGGIAEATCAVTSKQSDETQCINAFSMGISGVCSYTAGVSEVCAVKAAVVTLCGADFATGNEAMSACDFTSCSYNAASAAIAESCELALDRSTKATCELTPNGNTWSAAVADACTGGNATPLTTGAASTQTECESTGYTWDGTTTVCSLGAATDAAACTTTGNTWAAGSPIFCAEDSSATSQILCENNPTGLLWDGGACNRQLPGKVAENDCITMPSGGTYVAAQAQVAATCIDDSGAIVAGATQAACEGTATGSSWVVAACSDVARDVSTCLVTGNTWRAAVGGSCVTGTGGAVAGATELECLFATDGITPTAYTWQAAIADVCTPPDDSTACTTGTWTADASDRVVANGAASDTGTPFAGCVVAAVDQTVCESLASVNTWTPDACSDGTAAADRQACEGTSTYTFTPAIPAAAHSCAGNALWGAGTGDQTSCETVDSGADWKTATTIAFTNDQYEGICTPVNCAAVTVVDGSISGSSEFFYTGSGVDITCDTGFEPSGNEVALALDACAAAGHTYKAAKCSSWSSGACLSWTIAACVATHLDCQTGGIYNYAVPTCVAKECGSIDTTQGTVAAVSGNGLTFSATGAGGLTVTCSAGYEVVTDAKVGSCSDSSKATKTACEAVSASCSDALYTTAATCVDPAVWTGAGAWTLSAATTTRGYGTCSDATLTTKAACVADPTATWDEKTETFTCPASGSWDAAVPMCKPRRCPSYCNSAYCSDDQNDLDPGPAARLANGAIIGSRTYNPTSVTPDWMFSCNAGYTLTGATESSCMVNGAWSVPPPVCVLITWCELPANFERDMITDDDGTILGTRVLNIEDCWYPAQRIYGRNSPAGITSPDDTDPAQKATCNVRCFPTCTVQDDGSGVDNDGKPCVDAAGQIETTYTCLDGGEWEGQKPSCQRAPYSASGAPLAGPGLVLLLAAALLR